MVFLQWITPAQYCFIGTMLCGCVSTILNWLASRQICHNVLLVLIWGTHSGEHIGFSMRDIRLDKIVMRS